METLHEGDIGVPAHDARCPEADGERGGGNMSYLSFEGEPFSVEVHCDPIQGKVIVPYGDSEGLFISDEGIEGEAHIPAPALLAADDLDEGVTVFPQSNARYQGDYFIGQGHLEVPAFKVVFLLPLPWKTGGWNRVYRLIWVPFQMHLPFLKEEELFFIEN